MHLASFLCLWTFELRKKSRITAFLWMFCQPVFVCSFDDVGYIGRRCTWWSFWSCIRNSGRCHFGINIGFLLNVFRFFYFSIDRNIITITSNISIKIQPHQRWFQNDLYLLFGIGVSIVNSSASIGRVYAQIYPKNSRRKMVIHTNKQTKGQIVHIHGNAQCTCVFGLSRYVCVCLSLCYYSPHSSI